MQAFSLLSPEAIRNQLTNNSPSKVTHAFTKSKRFLSPNPEYKYINIDARWHITRIIKAIYRKRKQWLEEVREVILLKILLYHLLPAHIKQHHSSKKWIRHLVLVWVGKDLLKDPICIDSWRIIFLDHRMYLLCEIVWESGLDENDSKIQY